MEVLANPREQKVGSKTDLTFSYRQRLLSSLVVLVGGFLAVRFAAPHLDLDDLPRWFWKTAVVLSMGVAFVYWMRGHPDANKLTRTMRDSPNGWLVGRSGELVRIVPVVLPALAAGYFGPKADLPEAFPSIFRIEVSGSREYVAACNCLDPLKHSLAQDYWFICAYVVALAVAAAWSGAYFRIASFRRARRLVIAGVVAAGLLDVVENVCLRVGIGQIERGTGTDLTWHIAATCAWAKFAVLVAAGLYVIAGTYTAWITPRWVNIAAWGFRIDTTRTALRQAGKSSTKESSAGIEEYKLEADVNPPQDTHIPREGLARTRSDMPLSRLSERDTFGIALSGGGIRASSISLGALQVLESMPHGAPAGGLGWDRARAVTAVSGGSNMAAGWSIARSEYVAGQPYGDPDRSPEPTAWAMSADGEMSTEERHLLDNLGYLLTTQPRGSGADLGAPSSTQLAQSGADTGIARSARPTAIATVSVGLLFNTLVLMAILSLITRPVGWAIWGLVNHGGKVSDGAVRAWSRNSDLYFPGLSLTGLGVALLGLWVLLSQLLGSRLDQSATRRYLAKGLRYGSYGALGLGATLTLAWGFIELVGVMPKIGLKPGGISAAVGAIGVITSVGQILRKPAAKIAPMLGGIAFVVVALIGAAAFTWQATHAGPSSTGLSPGSLRTLQPLRHWQSVECWALLLIVLFVIQLTISPERWSIAAFYRGKLRLAYATRRVRPTQGEATAVAYRNDGWTPYAHEREPYLHDFNVPDQPNLPRTPLVVCTTSSAASRGVTTRSGFAALSVTFDPEHVTLNVPQDDGAWQAFPVATSRINALSERFKKRLTTMMAVALSSAAVSPAMGRYRIGPTSMLLTFFNVRLGVWMPNPRFLVALADNGEEDPGYAHTGLSYLFREFFGIHSLDDPYLYLTDGGHWENTGLVEMLRRRDITEIVCVDADSGAGDAVSSLGKAMLLAPLECGVRLSVHVDPLRAVPSGTRSPSYSERNVTLGFFQPGQAQFAAGDRVGVLWYMKPGLTPDMPARLLGFRETHEDFPRVSTMNQFFDEATFAAYRDLGRYNAQEILKAREDLHAVLATVLVEVDNNGATNALNTLAEPTEDGEPMFWVALELRRAVRDIGGNNVRDFCAAVQESLV